MAQTIDTKALIPPHGGQLIDLLVDPSKKAELQKASRDWPSWDLTARQMCDLELLMSGGFSPLSGFMTEADYTPVVEKMRLGDGTLWPMPITLDVTEHVAQQVQIGSKLALRDAEGVMLAALTVESKWRPDRKLEAEKVFGTASTEHPGSAHLLERTHDWYVGGKIEGLEAPTHYDFHDLRLTPKALRERFAERGWSRIVAFQTRNPMHRAHFELTRRAAEETDAHLLVHPVVGLTKPGDVDHYTRVRCYKKLLKQYPGDGAELSLLPLAMRMGGPREAVWHAIIRKNHGCTHLIVGRDHAGPGKYKSGEPFYGPYDAQELLSKHSEELGVEMVPFKMVVYLKEDKKFVPVDELKAGQETMNISGTELRSKLADGSEIPEWFTFPEVAKELRGTHPPKNKEGCTVFFTGLSGSGKSTVANVLRVKLLERGGRSVTILDGDLVRKHLSSELGFSKEHRDINIRRIGFVASEITRAGGFAICAPIAPYDAVRKEVRSLVQPVGGFFLTHMSTPLEVCEQRDRKGLYAKARAGIIKEFTGISDPYEAPEDAELHIDTSDISAEAAADMIIARLVEEGYLDS